MRFLISIFIICFVNCNIPTNREISFWETQKHRFKYKNKSEFLVDSTLRANYTTLKKSRHPLFGTVYTPVYLYSWQERDITKNEFTVIIDKGEHSLSIIYFILDKNDNLLSRTQIAGKGSEGDYWFETRSRFINKDIILNIGAITQWFDYEKRQEMEKTKGDSTFSHFYIDSLGIITEKEIKKVVELNFGNSE